MTDTALTVDQAVAELVSAPVEAAQEPEAPQEEQEPKATEEAAADPEPETADAEASEEAEPEAEEDPDAEEPEAAAIEPPKHWDAEDREWFKSQSPEVQARLLKQEEKREAVLGKHREKVAAEARQEVEVEREQITKIGGALKEWLPRAIAAHKMYWGENGFDLTANVEAYGADQALKLQAQYNAEVEQLDRVVEAQKLAEREERLSYQKQQYARLSELRPEMTDPKSGRAARETFAKEILALGATPDELEIIPAWGVDLALDGLKYRKAQAEAKAKAKPQPKPAPPAVKPSAPPASSQPTRTVQQISRRLSQTGDLDDAVALILAEDEARRRA